MALLTCFGIPLQELKCDQTNVVTLFGTEGDLSVRIGPSFQGWYGYFQLSLPRDFYSINEPWATNTTIPTTHVCAENPQDVIDKLELLGRLLLPHFEKIRPSAWIRLASKDSLKSGPELEEARPSPPDDPT